MNTGVLVVAILIVAGGWWIPLVIWSRRWAKHWHRFDAAHEAAFREEHLREHERRKERLGPRPGGSSDWRTNEALATYLRAYERIFEDCPCPHCVSMWLMCKMADSPNPRHQELSKHMAKTVGVLLVGVALALGGCASAFHAPFDRSGNRAWVAGGHGDAWAYSVPVPGHGDLLAYFGWLSGVGERQRCQTNRANMLALRRITGATECRPIILSEGGPLWAVSLLNSDDGFVFQSREACEAGRRANDWGKAGYLPSACTPVSVTP